MSGKHLIVLLLLLQSGGIACARKTIYDWGSYNPAVYRFYNSEPPYDVSEDIELLGTEIEKTPVGRVPPGKAAHLGMLYSMKGENARAKEYLSLEKKMFPESAALMNRLILKLK